MLNFYDTQGMIPEIRDGMGGWRQEVDMAVRGRGGSEGELLSGVH